MYGTSSQLIWDIIEKENLVTEEKKTLLHGKLTLMRTCKVFFLLYVTETKQTTTMENA